MESKSKRPGARTTSNSMRPTSRPVKGHSVLPSKRANAISAEEHIAELEEALAHERRERTSAEEHLQESLERAVRMGERLQLAEAAAKRAQARARDPHLGARAESVLEKLMEMHTTLIATASALDDLTHREADLLEVRTRTIEDARRILLSTAGMTYDANIPSPPAVAPSRPPPIDISEVAELIESFRPGPVTPSNRSSRAPKK